MSSEAKNSMEATQNTSNELPVAADEVLDIIRTISEGDSNYNPFETAVNMNTKSENPHSSIAKSSMMTEASPEPEPNQRSQDAAGASSKECENEEYYSERYRRLNKVKLILLSVIVGLGIAFLCTLVGVVVLATLKPAPGPPNILEPVDVPQLLFDIPRSPLEFAHVDGKSPNIAEAFADHSLYQTFYGVTYDGAGLVRQEIFEEKRSSDYPDKQATSATNSFELQRRITLDVALLSRVTSRLRLTSNENRLIERVIQALQDLNFRMMLTLSITASEWEQNGQELMRIIRSYPLEYIEAIHIEREGDRGYEEASEVSQKLAAFFKQYDLHGVKVNIVDAQIDQPNPLNLTGTPRVAVEWMNDDNARSVYTNLVTPSETSERARFMTSWVCGVVPNLVREVEWFWSVAFDDLERDVKNGIFTEDRKAKPACLPRCLDY